LILVAISGEPPDSGGSEGEGEGEGEGRVRARVRARVHRRAGITVFVVSSSSMNSP